jgi:hypothetical protein
MLVLKRGFKFGLIILQGENLLEVEGTIQIKKDTKLVISFSEAENT